MAPPPALSRRPMLRWVAGSSVAWFGSALLGCRARAGGAESWPSVIAPGHENDPPLPTAAEMMHARLEEQLREAAEFDADVPRAEGPLFHEAPAPPKGPWTGILCVRNVGIYTGCTGGEHLRTYLVLQMEDGVAPLVDPPSALHAEPALMRGRDLGRLGFADEQRVWVDGSATAVLLSGTISMSWVWGLVVRRISRTG